MNAPPSHAATPPSRGLHSTWHTVRLDWRPFASAALLTSIPLIAAGLDAWLRDGDDSQLFTGMGLLVASLVLCLLIANVRHFRYNPLTRRIEPGRRWGPGKRVRPGSGYERLEFSPGSGEVHKVAFDGRRRRVPIGSHSANRADWTRFVGRMFPGSTTPIPVRPRDSRTRSDPMAPSLPHSGGRLITIGIDKRRYRRMTAVAVPVCLASYAAGFFVIEPGAAWDAALMSISTGFLGTSIGRLCQAHYFKYHSRGWIEARDHWGRKRVYPRKGFLRLEYSPALGELHEIRADGERRRLFIGRHMADPRDWEEFVKDFHPGPAPVPVRSNPSSGPQ